MYTDNEENNMLNIPSVVEASKIDSPIRFSYSPALYDVSDGVLCKQQFMFNYFKFPSNAFSDWLLSVTWPGDKTLLSLGRIQSS